MPVRSVTPASTAPSITPDPPLSPRERAILWVAQNHAHQVVRHQRAIRYCVRLLELERDRKIELAQELDEAAA